MFALQRRCFYNVRGGADSREKNPGQSPEGMLKTGGISRRVRQKMKRYAFGIDIGGTSVKLGLFGIDGVLLESWEIPTRTENSGENILPDIARSVKESLLKRKLILNTSWASASAFPDLF